MTNGLMDINSVDNYRANQNISDEANRDIVNSIKDEIYGNLVEVNADIDDYIGEDGLLYCGSCHTAKEAFFAEGRTLFGKDRHPCECECQRKDREKREAEELSRKHLDTVERLKKLGFTDTSMREWTFDNDNGLCPQMDKAHFYVDNWEQMQEKNIGYLLWGGVGTGKSFFAGCIANALIDKEVSVCMTNFPLIINDLTASFEGRNEYIKKLVDKALLIIDDFGTESGSDYRMEQVYNVIDSRYRSHKPLIITTNLPLDALKHPPDVAHARIYDRVLEMCVPIHFTGKSIRKESAESKLRELKDLMNEGRDLAYDK